VDVTELSLRTGDRLVTDVTSSVAEFCRTRGDGLLTVLVPHATAGVAVLETGSGSEQDLAEAVDRLLPRGAGYRHSHGSPGHGRDHVLPAFVAPSLTLPVVDGRPLLGTWQSVVVVDSNADNPERRLVLSFLPG
jgi:secondary thiamine-phosphate synthase enzyme